MTSRRSLLVPLLMAWTASLLCGCQESADPVAEDVAAIWTEAELGLLTSLSLSAASPPPMEDTLAAALAAAGRALLV